MQISDLAKKLNMRPTRLSMRAKQLGLAGTSPDHELTEMEIYLLERTRNEPLARLKESAEKLKTGEAFPITLNSGARGAGSTVHVLHEQDSKPSQQMPAIDQQARIELGQLRSHIAELRRDLHQKIKKNEDVSLAESLESLTKSQERQEQRLAATEKSIEILLEMQTDSEHLASNAARAEQQNRVGLEKIRIAVVDISSRSQAQRSELEENAAAISGLARTLRGIADSLDGFDHVLTSLSGRTDEQSLRLEGVSLNVSRLEGRFDAVNEEQEKARQVAKRVAQAAKDSLKLATLDLSRKVASVQEMLRAKKLFFTDRLISSCLSAVVSGRPILFTGPPGTGKTALARALPSLYFEGDVDEIATCIEVNHSWGAFEMLGGAWPVGDMIMPKLGAFSRAVVECIERGGRHWLLIDELNRADPDRIFSGLLSTLADLGRNPYLQLAEVEAPLRIPTSFRMICIANEINLGHLFPLSQELRERFLEIRVPPPPRDMESEILLAKFDLEDLDRSAKKEFNHQVDQLLGLLERIRDLGRERALPQMEIGVRTSIQIVERVIIGKAQSGMKISELFDHIVRDEIMAALSSLPVEMLQVIADSAIEARQFPLLHSAVIDLQRQTRDF